MSYETSGLPQNEPSLKAAFNLVVPNIPEVEASAVALSKEGKDVDADLLIAHMIGVTPLLHLPVEETQKMFTPGASDLLDTLHKFEHIEDPREMQNTLLAVSNDTVRKALVVNSAFNLEMTAKTLAPLSLADVTPIETEIAPGFVAVMMVPVKDLLQGAVERAQPISQLLAGTTGDDYVESRFSAAFKAVKDRLAEPAAPDVTPPSSKKPGKGGGQTFDI